MAANMQHNTLFMSASFFLGRPGTLSDRTRICQCYDCGLSPVFNGIHSFRIRQKIFCCTCSVLL